jgi:hypothetical protein
MNVPYICDTPFAADQFITVDVVLEKDCFRVVGKILTENAPRNNLPRHAPSTLMEEFNKLDTSLCQICGNVCFPVVDGKLLMKKISQKNKMLVGASDASLKDGIATQVWILTSGDAEDLNNDLLHLAGAGPVDGYHPYLSSTRAEIAGITAVLIISQLLLKFHASPAKVTLLCDNQAAITTCSNSYVSNLCYHRKPTSDLLITL